MITRTIRRARRPQLPFLARFVTTTVLKSNCEVVSERATTNSNGLFAYLADQYPELKTINAAKPLSPHAISAIVSLRNDGRALDTLINAYVYQHQTTSEPPTTQHLDSLATSITSMGQSTDIRTLLNYRTLTSLVYPQVYENLPLATRYRIFHQPHITTAGPEDYTMRVEQTMSYLREIDQLETSDEDLRTLRRKMRPDIADTITISLNMFDEEYALAFLDLYLRHYGDVPIEDSHSWMMEALGSGCSEFISVLLRNTALFEHLPTLEKEMAIPSLAKVGDVDTALKLWDSNGQMNSHEASLLSELFGARDVVQSLEIMDYIEPSCTEDFKLTDFQFLADLLKKELRQLGTERLDTDKSSSTERYDGARSGIVKRPDIVALIDRHGAFYQSFSMPVKSMYANLLLKTLSELTNTTGVIFTYMHIPAEYLNSLSYSIVFRSCERGDDGSLRAWELFRYARSRGLAVEERAYASLFKTSAANYEELLFYLGQYFSEHPELSSLTRQRMGLLTTFKWVPNRSKDMIRSLLDPASDPSEIIRSAISQQPSDFLTTFEPKKHRSYYDLRESSMLKRHHLSSI